MLGRQDGRCGLHADTLGRTSSGVAGGQPAVDGKKVPWSDWRPRAVAEGPGVRLPGSGVPHRGEGRVGGAPSAGRLTIAE